MATLESRIGALEKNANNSDNYLIAKCTKEEAQAVYDAMMNSCRSGSLVDIPTGVNRGLVKITADMSPQEAMRIYQKMVQGK